MDNKTAPPIPNRDRQWTTSGGRVAYNSYSPMNNCNYQTYTPTSYNFPYSFGGYGNTFNQNMNYNGFTQLAAEQSRAAFQSIENIVNAFGSVSMMLQSSYQAVFNSFHAVIGVAENFSRLKTQLLSVFSALSLFRFLRYFYRRLLQLFGLQLDMDVNDAWKAAKTRSDITSTLGGGSDKCNWPIIVYMTLILGAPWLIWKLVAQFVSNQTTDTKWATGEEHHYVARVIYDFTARSHDEISCKAGQHVKLAPKHIQPMIKDWLLGSVDGQSIGLIPATYVTVLGPRPGEKQSGTSHIKRRPAGHLTSDSRDMDNDTVCRDGDIE